MGSISTIEDELKLYDDIYGIAYALFTPTAIPIFVRDTKQATTTYPSQHVYLEQTHGAYVKRTLNPSIYDVDVELLCEINVTHDNIAQGRSLAKSLQRSYHSKASSYGLVVKEVMATDNVTVNGHIFVVALTLLYTTKV